jgi:hypothetical protein
LCSVSSNVQRILPASPPQAAEHSTDDLSVAQAAAGLIVGFGGSFSMFGGSPNVGDDQQGGGDRDQDDSHEQTPGHGFASAPLVPAP